MKEISSNEKFFWYFNTNVKTIIDYLTEIRDHSYAQNRSADSADKKIDLYKDKKINFY